MLTVTIIIGGQYGGEGKGKITSYIALKDKPKIVVRGSGPNAGHTVCHLNTDYRFRILPSAAFIKDVELALGPGTLINKNILFDEINHFNCIDRIFIDGQAGIISHDHINQQKIDNRYELLGTTYQGTGIASSDRCLRKLKLANSCQDLKPYIDDVPQRLYNYLKNGYNVLLEGSQSYGLSNYHGDYPYTTSRDTTAAALCSETGVGIKHVTDIILVIKAFPTRNHAGLLPNEMPTENADGMGFVQYSTEGIRRRVGLFDINIVRKAVIVNSATSIALTCVDFIDPSVRGCKCFDELSSNVKKLVRLIEEELKIPVVLISTGKKTLDIIDRR